MRQHEQVEEMVDNKESRFLASHILKLGERLRFSYELSSANSQQENTKTKLLLNQDKAKDI